MDTANTKLHLQDKSFKTLVDLWLEAKTGKGGLSDQLPLNDLLQFMGCLETIIRHQQADDLLQTIVFE